MYEKARGFNAMWVVRQGCHHEKFHLMTGITVSADFEDKKEGPRALRYLFQVQAVPEKSYYRAQEITIGVIVPGTVRISWLSSGNLEIVQVSRLI